MGFQTSYRGIKNGGTGFNMGNRRNGIDRYEVIKICLVLFFIAVLKVWDSTRNWQLAVLTFSGPVLFYIAIKGIRRYYRWKSLLESGIDVIDSMSGIEFEELLLAYYKKLGYRGSTTPKTGDYGADLVLEKGNQRIVVQAKRWKNIVGIEAVQQIIGAIKYYGAVKGMVVTNSVFTENAHKLARVNGVELIDREKLIEIMRKSRGKSISINPSGRGGLETDKTFGILSDENCPICGRVLVRRKGKFGAFIGCSGFPGCRFTRQV